MPARFAEAADKPYSIVPAENHRPETAMDEDDLPPPPRHSSGGFGAALGHTVGRFLWIAIFFGILALAILGLKYWF